MQARYLRPKQVGELFGLNPKTLANLRSKGRGPKFIKMGKLVLYPVDEIERWIRTHGILVKTADSE